MTDCRKRTDLGHLPDVFQAEDVEDYVRNGVNQLDDKILELCEREPAATTQVVQAAPRPAPGEPIGVGRTIVGSLSGSAIPLVGVPGPDEAVILRVAPDSRRDRWISSTVSSTVYEGPGRIWNVQRVEGNAPARGPARYRLIYDKMLFGVLGVRFLDQFSDFALDNDGQSGSRWEVTYGLILSGIPKPGVRIPFRVSTDFMNSPPSSMVGLNLGSTANWLSGSTVFFDSEATTKYDSAPRTLFFEQRDPNVASVGWMHPTKESANYVSDVQGIVTVPITSRSPEDVYAQVNSLFSENSASIGGNSHGPSGSSPQGESAISACPSSALAVSSASQLVARTSATLVGTDKVAEGIPVRYADCLSLTPEADTMSVILYLNPPRVLEWRSFSDTSTGMFAAATNDMLPATWHTTGVVLDKPSDRFLEIDLILE